MSIHPNLRNPEAIVKATDDPNNYKENGNVLSSKIRKFFFLLQNKQIERDLRVTISVVIGEKLSEQNVLLELTNDVNPIFLFVLCITESDFQILRSSQALNVEFINFPDALINLFDKCINLSGNEGRYKLMLKDYCGTAGGGCIMDMNKIQIQIMEECAFRNICHLSLDIMRGTELQIRQKLETEVYKVKQCLQKTSKLYEDAVLKITELKQELVDKTSKTEILSNTIKSMKGQREEEHEVERAQYEKQSKALRVEFENKISEERRLFQSQSSQLQNKISNLETELRNFHEKQLEMQSIIHEKEREKELIELELISKKQEVYQLRSQNEKLDSDYHDKEKTVNILRTRLAVTEQELKDNSILLASYQNKLEAETEEKNTIQKRFDTTKSKVEKKESLILSLSEELLKANEIISKQQSKISILTSKVNERDETLSKQEKVLQEKEEMLYKKCDTVKQLEGSVNNSADRVKELCNKISYLETKLQSANDKIKSKHKSIAKMREDIKDQCFHSHLSKTSLLYYRTFLSMPSLLPSDYTRRTDDMWDLLLDDCTTVDDDDDVPNKRKISSVTSNIIRPFLYRYIKRFQCVPVPLFSYPEIPTNVLLSPDGSNPYPPGVKLHPYKSFLKKIGNNDSLPSKNNRAKLSETSLDYIGKEKCLQISSSTDNSNFYEASKPSFKYRTKSPLKQKNSVKWVYPKDGQFPPVGNIEEKDKHKNIKVRTTPAVGAPPLTAEQRKKFATDNKTHNKKLHAGKITRGVQPTKINMANPQPMHSCSQPFKVQKPVSHAYDSNQLHTPTSQPFISYKAAPAKTAIHPPKNFKNLDKIEPSAYFAV